MQRKSTFAACVGAGVITAAMLWLILHLAGAHLDLPLNYLKDANVFLVRAKGIVEGNWVWRNPRLGMPFGANWIDFPMNVTLDSGVMWILSRFTSSVPLIVNLDWILEVSAMAALGAYAFLRLGLARALAMCCGVVFALQPYTWFQSTKHLHCLSCAVPLVGAAAIDLIRGRFETFRRVPPYAWIACVLAGLSYAYLAFFSCLVLICAAALAWMGRRDRQSLAIGLTLTGCIVGVALADLSPSLLYQARHGANAAMLFKSPAEGEVYGLKIRYLLTPTPDHPLGFVRRLEKSLAGTKFPSFENENEYTRLGTVGSIGLVVLIGLLLGAMVNARMAERASGTMLGPCAALTLACLLFATTGGFSTFFNTWVFPDIRAWARIFPFMGFFCVVAAGAIADPFVRRFPRWGGIAVLGTITILAVFDQAVPSFAFDRSDAVYRQDGEFVGEIEKRLPADSAVFQLPYVDFPNDNHPGTMLVNDSLRPYLHSAKYRWSAGAVSGMTSAEWNRVVAGSPAPEMLNALAHAGFGGLWLDRAGFDAGQSPEDAITHELGVAPLHDAGNRLLFYDLRSYHGDGSIPVESVFERGFYFPENGIDGVHRWSLKRGRVTLINPLPSKRRVLVRMRIGTADGAAHAVRVGSDRMQAPGAYEKQIDMPASGRIALDITCDCPGVRTDNRTLYFWVSAFAVSDV